MEAHIAIVDMNSGVCSDKILGSSENAVTIKQVAKENETNRSKYLFWKDILFVLKKNNDSYLSIFLNSQI